MGISATLFLAVVVLGWLYRAEIKEAAKLAEQQKHLTNVVSDQNKTIHELQEQREHLQKILKKRAEQQRRIEQRAQEKLADMKTELQQLRREYEEVNNFLNIRVPAEFVSWLREKNNNENKDNQTTATGESNDNGTDSGQANNL